MTNPATYKVKGMHCASCSAIIERTIGKQAGVNSVSVNYANEKAKIDFDSSKTSIENLSKSIEPLGYSIVAENVAIETGEGKKLLAPLATTHQHTEVDNLRRKIRIAIPLVILTSIIMVWELLVSPFEILPEMPEILKEFFHHLLPVIATYAMFVTGNTYLKGIWTFIRHGAANMDTLIGIGTSTAYLYSFIITAFEEPLSQYINTAYTYYDVTIVVIGLITLGKYLEARSKLRTGDAIKKLLNLQVKTAIVIRNGKEMEISVDQVAHNDLILVKPGMKIPVDGIVEKGSTNIDESMLTGEPIPVLKQEGDKIAAGTINTTGSITMKATGVGSETLLAHIIKMVEEAQGSRAPIQKLADKISGIFVPIVLVISAVTLILWLAVGSQFMAFSQALSFGLVAFVSILVIACPCALGLATPTAIIVGVGKGALNGILIKNAEVLEKLYKIDTLVIDKTGTITKGKPEVLDIKISEEKDKKEILSILATLEKHSEHPLAESIVNYAKKKNIPFKSAADFKNIPGKGITASVNDITYFAGSSGFIAEMKIPFDEKTIEEIAKKGLTPIILATKKEPLAIVGIGDALKEEAREAIEKLHSMKIKIIMATGDNKITAEHIAGQIGIDDIISQVSPEKKLRKIEELQEKGHIVAMAGDGVNDAPALAKSNVGIAMSTGTDVSIETSDITLLHGDIRKIAQAITLSRYTMRTIKQNLFWAFIYNIIGIPLASGIFYPLFGWLLSPVFAGLAMAFSSVSVVTNSLRLKTRKI